MGKAIDKMSGIVTHSRLGQMGRLGNQLFQVATTIAYAHDNNKLINLPNWEYLNCFPTLADRIGNSIHPSANIYNEPHFHYSPIPYIEGDVDLVGFFQSEKYFKKHEPEIRKIFSIQGEFLKLVVKKIEVDQYGYCIEKSLEPRKRCAIHIRRGDYATNVHTNAYHGLLPVEYYEAGAEAIYGDKKPKDVLFHVFSDDIPWCKANLKFPHMVFSEGETDIVDLYKMSMCDDFIIANSSFSWWGAWLCPRVEKRVVAPRSWFSGARLFCEDIYCKDWIRV